jgi:hypothetical protein
MKRLFFGLIATVMFSVAGNAQVKTDFDGNIKDLKLRNVTTELASRKIKITIKWEAGRWCFKDDPGCKGSVDLRTAPPKKNGKIDITWDNLERQDFEMPNAKLFRPETNGTEYFVYIPKQKLVYNKEANTFEAIVEFYTK